ncbi:NAD(+) diphosphatase [Rhodococcus rhodochrous]|uniref:NAD(+) diphosphatase n=1 Tax=Rhodococcus rhodochrous TaxID=1829 RepID=UPI00036DDA3C|nr:NAD(+) diphosphatase [Rhodococcus rhodochrous]
MTGFALSGTPLLSRTVVDRAEELRKDEDALRAGWADAKLLRVDRRNQVRVSDSALVLGEASELGPEPVEGAIFLGIRDGHHVWATRVLAQTGTVADLRRVGERLDDADADLMVSAVALLNWHDNAGYSAVDGSPTRPTMSGWSRISTETGHEEFPRTDPAIICLVHDGHDRVLLARQPVWPERRFSVLAGFVEAGESLESCVVREIREEVGVEVRDVRYLGSQPWPFPRSLMLGFAAIADPEQALDFRDGEITEARWFTREEVRAALATGDWASVEDAPLLLPGSISIARGMLEGWAKE